jgi:hypothetical protein
MAANDFPDLIAPWTRVPLVHDTTDLFPDETMDALDARYSGVVPDASTTVKGIVELATDAETVTGSDTVRATTPAGVAAAIAGIVAGGSIDASTTAKGIVELATDAEATTGTDTVRAVTPHALAAALATVTVPDASTTVKGIVELATSAETTTGTDAVRAVTPAGLKAVTDLNASGMMPGVGMALRPGTTTGAAAVVLNNFTLTPQLVSKRVTVDAFLRSAAGTNGTTHEVGLYPSNADGTPNFTSGPLRSVSFTFGSTAAPTVTFTALVLEPGLYYYGFRSGGTGPSVSRCQTPAPLPFLPAGWGITQVGYSDSGVTGLPSGSFTPTATTNSSAIFWAMMRISAV